MWNLGFDNKSETMFVITNSIEFNTKSFETEYMFRHRIVEIVTSILLQLLLSGLLERRYIYLHKFDPFVLDFEFQDKVIRPSVSKKPH